VSVSAIDTNYLKAVEEICDELLKLGLPEQFVNIIAQATQSAAQSDSTDRVKDRFPEAMDVVSAFPTESLRESVKAAMSGGGIVLTGGQSAAVQLQVAMLLELRRQYGRKKLSRTQQIVRAAHRRAIVTGADGSVKHDLIRRVTRLLLNA
jgi:cell division ATPase FtsA